MTVTELTKNSSPEPGRRVVALGFFDGVHEAHRELIGRAVREAGARGLECAVFTFPSEEEGLKPNAGRLTTTAEKLALISSLGADRAFLCPLSGVKDMSAGEFVSFLTGTLGCVLAVAGYNFRFAKGASAGAGDLVRLMEEKGGAALICPERTAEGEILSSSLIREKLTAGKAEDAARLLGVPYSFAGKVEHGRAFGRSLGFPTVNLPWEKGKILPRAGVYRSFITAGGKGYYAVTDLGTCPTFGARLPHSETFVFGLDRDLYGEEVRVFLLGYLREEKTFDGENALKMQINIDINEAKKRNGGEDAEKTAAKLLSAFKEI